MSNKFFIVFNAIYITKGLSSPIFRRELYLECYDQGKCHEGTYCSRKCTNIEENGKCAIGCLADKNSCNHCPESYNEYVAQMITNMPPYCTNQCQGFTNEFKREHLIAGMAPYSFCDINCKSQMCNGLCTSNHMMSCFKHIREMMPVAEEERLSLIYTCMADKGLVHNGNHSKYQNNKCYDIDHGGELDSDMDHACPRSLYNCEIEVTNLESRKNFFSCMIESMCWDEDTCHNVGEWLTKDAADVDLCSDMKSDWKWWEILLIVLASIIVLIIPCCIKKGNGNENLYGIVV